MAHWNTQLEPWMAGVAAKLFKEGKSIAETATFIRVTRDRLSGWLAEGMKEDCRDGALVAFAQACCEARATHASNFKSTTWQTFCENDVRAAILEMKALYPEQYGQSSHKTVDVNVTHSNAKPIRDLSHMTDEELRLQAEYEEMQERLAARKALTRG